ncbi:unnamed protein product [Kuraishia capsulata CBS 1993]|uniref:Uncharacterized protein n=1 Tax=Kuraishia capsulata CBS 1993 TaxID=1382522 RepID=W6MSF0_9ASCO|nr:uncharacterized protein KUCA_T00000691001 [Kuraishia capsulata CBS 1993]CDK24725.1 unnamed protein product [Kuraishia capsulata CBS 1993]
MGEFPRQIIQLFRETQQRELAPSVQRAQIVITKSSVRFVNEAQLRDQFHAGYVNALRYRGDQLKRRRGMFANKYAVLVVQDFNYYRREETWEQTFLRPFVYDTDLYQDAYCKQAIVESRGGEGDSDDELQVIGVSPRTGDQLRKLGFSTGKIEMSS